MQKDELQLQNEIKKLNTERQEFYIAEYSFTGIRLKSHKRSCHYSPAIKVGEFGFKHRAATQ
jgi:hypothetical protein